MSVSHCILVLFVASIAPAAVAGDAAAAPVTLDEAILEARAQSPELRAASERIAAARSLRGQAGALPNPEISAAWEGIDGDPIEEADLILAVGLPLDLAGVARARRREADAEVEAARARREGAIRDLDARVREAFHGVVAARALLAVADSAAGVTEATALAVRRQLEAGKVSPVLLTRAEAAEGTARAEAAAARSREIVARRRLAALLGRKEAADLEVRGELRAPGESLSRGDLLGELRATHPAVLESRWTTARLAHAGSVARRERWPRLVPEVGLRRRASADATDLRAGVSFELPLFDRKGQAAQAAEQERAAAAAGTEALIRDLVLDAETGLLALDEATARLRAYEGGILPRAREALDLVRLGYERGKFDLLELLDAQRVFNETLARAVEARIAADAAVTRLESLAGRDLMNPVKKEDR